MTDIAPRTFFGVLYWFYVILGCFMLFALAMDLIAIANHQSLRFIGFELKWPENLINVAFDIVVVVWCAISSKRHGKIRKDLKWR